MNLGDIWLINLGGRIVNRPVIALTRQNLLDYLNKVTICRNYHPGRRISNRNKSRSKIELAKNILCLGR